MIKNIDLLSTEDKLFMLYNKKCFTNSTKSSISFNSIEWETEINNTVNPDDIEFMRNKERKMYSDMLGAFPQLSNPDIIKNFTDKLFNDIVLETSDTIMDFMMFCYTNIQNIKKRGKASDEQIAQIYRVLYDIFVPWKITANVIYKKTSYNIKSDDEGLNNYLYNINKILFKELSNTKDVYSSSIIIYNILINLGLDKNDTYCIDFLLDGKKYLNNEDITSLKSIVIKLLDRKLEPSNVLDGVSIGDLGEYGDKLLEFTRRKMEDNYLKSKISDEINNVLCIGDDIFPDHEAMNVGNLLVELDQLTEEEIKQYINKDDNIVYMLNDDEVRYLKEEEGLPICKVLKKTSGFSTLTKINNESYLMFKIYGDNKLYGISFPASLGGRRNLVEIDINK